MYFSGMTLAAADKAKRHGVHVISVGIDNGGGGENAQMFRDEVRDLASFPSHANSFMIEEGFSGVLDHLNYLLKRICK